MTFDLWYTLVYLEPDEQEAYFQQLGEELGGLAASWPVRAGSAGAARRRGTDPLDAFWDTFQACASAGARGRSVSLREQGRWLAARLGRIPDPEGYYRLAARVVSKQPLKPTPGARLALRQLRARGWHVGLISNTVGEPGFALRAKLRALDLASSIEAWAFSDQLPWTKPAPAIFRYALRSLRTNAGRAVHVGDGESDVAGARAAGFRAGFLFDRPPAYSPTYRQLFPPARPTEAKYRVSDLAKLPDRLEALPLDAFAPGPDRRGGRRGLARRGHRSTIFQ